MDRKIHPDELSGLDQWIIDDLHKSGLTPENFTLGRLNSEVELNDRLGFVEIAGISIMDAGGYWIIYPEKPGYYRLKLKENIGDAKYLSPRGRGNKAYVLPEVRRLLENYSPDKFVFITEGEKKAAKANLEGFPCIGLSGVWNFKDSESDFLVELDGFVWKDRTIFIVFDSDITGKHSVKHAELRLAAELIKRGAKPYSVRLPNEPSGTKNGLDDYLVRYGSEAFRGLLEQVEPTLELHVAEGVEAGLIIQVITRIDNEITRARTLKLLAKREGVNLEAVQAEYRKYVQEKSVEVKTQREVFTDEEISQAKTLLNSSDMLSRLPVLTKKLGFTGEELNQKLLYLSFTSRIMSSSISTIVKGPSSTGKSYLVNTIARLFPVEDVLTFSFITAKSLVHRQGDLSHKILSIAEHAGSEGADYSIRTLLSEKEISILSSVKNEVTGNWEAVEKRIPADGLVYVETTTRDRVNPENQTRLFDIYLDDDFEQTKNILEIQAAQIESESQELESEIRIWRAAQTLLENHKVYIPYAKELANAFPKEKARSRRDFPRLLSLIRSHTLLHQFKRKRGSDDRLIATSDDLEGVLPIIERVLEDSQRELSPKQIKVLTVIQSDSVAIEFGAKDVFIHVDKIVTSKTLQRYLKHFSREGFIEWNGERGHKSRYTKQDSSNICMSSTSSFVCKVRGLLQRFWNIEDNSRMSSSEAKSLNGTCSGHKPNKGHFQKSSSLLNDNSEICSKNGDKDIETQSAGSNTALEESELPFHGIRDVSGEVTYIPDEDDISEYEISE